MTEAKKRPERKFVDADGGKSEKAEIKKMEEIRKKAKPLRIVSWILWILAIACEIILVLLINGTIYAQDPSTFLYIGLAVDFILVLIAGQLWKKANDCDPASKSDEFKFFLQNQLGTIMTIVAFLPLIIIILTNKNLDGKTKKLASIIGIVLMLIAGIASYDFNPPSQEDLAQAKAQAASVNGGIAYWTRFGKSYHFDPNCQTLLNSEVIFHGSVEEAFAANRNDPCDFCVKEIK